VIARSTCRWVVSVVVAAGVLASGTAVRARGDGCAGNCDGDALVNESDAIIAVGDALEASAGDVCASLDVGPPDGRITVNEVITGIQERGPCPAGFETPTATRTATTTQTATPTLTTSPSASATPTPTRTQTATRTQTSTVTPTATSPTRTASPTATPTTGWTPIARAIERDTNGIALHAGDTLITEGVVTVAAGVLQNRKLKIFLQDGPAGIEVFNANAGDLPIAFQAGDRLRVTGVISQDPDPLSENRALGTVAVVIGKNSWTPLSQGNALPEPILADVAGLVANGNAYAGSLVRVEGVQKVEGDWPIAPGPSTQVTIADGTGERILMRLQRNTLTTELLSKLTVIGDKPFDLVSIAVQDDLDGGPPYLSGYELWIRGAGDVLPIK